MATANLALRFIVELVGVGAFGYWGYQAGGDGIGRLGLAIGAMTALIVVWALLVAPNADNPLTQPQRNIIGTLLMLVAATGVAVVGHPTAALVFGTVVVVNWLLLVLGTTLAGSPA